MDMAEHVKATKRPVVLDDDPLRLRFGFHDPESGTVWQIGFVRVLESLLSPKKLAGMTEEQRAIDDRAHETIMHLFRTPEGRLCLANAWVAS